MDIDQEEIVTQPEDRKVRQCLRCQERFESTWIGERICPRCKGSQAWRQGLPAHSQH